jgi:hypothetical protein
MSLPEVRSLLESVERVRQAVFEAADLRDCLDFAMEDLARCPAFLDPLQEGFEAPYVAVKDGSYAFRCEDLPFMDLAGKYPEEIPFHTLLKQINETHRRGLDVGGDDA